MTTYTNQAKSSSTFVNEPLTGVSLWDDSHVGWDAVLFSWDATKTVGSDTSLSSSAWSTDPKH